MHESAVATAAATRIRVSEIFRSLQGESTWAGYPCVFVRFSGCSLRCVWCDTAYAFDDGEERTIANVVEEVLGHDVDLVEITGGEPLEQDGFHPLAAALLDAGRRVLVETGGHVALADVDRRVVKIVDWKAPGSGMERSNDWSNVELLAPDDEVKIVVADRRDFDWAVEKVRETDVWRRVRAVSISPVWEGPNAAEVAGWVRECGLPLRLNLQLHKLLWGERRGV